jgi:hypothetical protein
MTEELWRAAVGAGLGVAATLGWVAAGTSNAHADADEAEVISNWSNAHQCQAPGALLATPPRPIKREGAYSACVHTSMLASWCGVERVDTRVRRTRELRVRGRWMRPPLLQLARSQCTARHSLTTCVAAEASAVWAMRYLSVPNRTAPRIANGYGCG